MQRAAQRPLLALLRLGGGLQPADAGMLAPAAAALPAVAASSTAAPWWHLPRRGLAAAGGEAPEGHHHHHHHEYADSHRPHDAPVYRVGKGGRVVASRAATAPHHRRRHLVEAVRAAAARPAGPPEAALRGLAGQLGVGDAGAFLGSVAKLQVERQHALLEHAASVAGLLQGLGIQNELIGRVAESCPALFSFAAEERAQVLFGELMAAEVGKSAGEAAELFVRCPALANTRHIMPSVIKVVADHHTD